MKVECKRVKFEGAILKRFVELKTAISKDAIEKNLKSNFIQLFGVFVDSFFVGCIFTRIDKHYDFSEELVIMYTFTMQDSNDLNFVSILNPIYDKLAHDMKVKKIRIHSERKGHDILLEKNGYKFLETVYTKDL